MGARLPDPKELGKYFALAQIGIEMVTPLGVGVGLDYYFGWTIPWGSVIGAIVGLIGGLAHLMAILNRKDNSKSTKSPQEGK